MDKKRVIVIGGGMAGLRAALSLHHKGADVLLLERDEELGGKVRGWNRLFPTFTPASEVLNPLIKEFKESGIAYETGCEVTELTDGKVQLADGRELPYGAVVVASGFTLFDARLKEEYGYGLYDNVYTSSDLEQMFRQGRVTLKDGSKPRRIALLHCVGSRDEKVCSRHCSRVCCITGVKQAIELRALFPEADIFNFYMDIRMFGPGYEELYREAQYKSNIHFIRGRISEAAPTLEGRIQIKAEDTLTGRPLRMGVDMLILLVGWRANAENAKWAASAGLKVASNGFFEPRDLFLHSVESNVEGIFYAGAVTAPKSIGEAINEAEAVACRVIDYINR